MAQPNDAGNTLQMAEALLTQLPMCAVRFSFTRLARQYAHPVPNCRKHQYSTGFPPTVVVLT